MRFCRPACVAGFVVAVARGPPPPSRSRIVVRIVCLPCCPRAAHGVRLTPLGSGSRHSIDRGDSAYWWVAPPLASWSVRSQAPREELACAWQRPAPLVRFTALAHIAVRLTSAEVLAASPAQVVKRTNSARMQATQPCLRSVLCGLSPAPTKEILASQTEHSELIGGKVAMVGFSSG